MANHLRAAIALTAAMIEAQQWADRVDNKDGLAEMLGKRVGLNVPAAACSQPQMLTCPFANSLQCILAHSEEPVRKGPRALHAAPQAA